MLAHFHALARLTLAVSLSLCAQWARAEESAPIHLSLGAALRRALDDAPAVLAARARLSRVRAEADYARGAYFPRLALEASSGLSHDSRETTPNKIDLPEAVTPEERDAYLRSVRTPRYEATAQNTVGRLSVDYPLLDAARGPSMTAAAKSVTAHTSGVGVAQRAALLAAAELHLESVAAHALLEDARLSEARRAAASHDIGALVKAGLRPSVDALRAEIELVGARYAVTARALEEQAARAALAAALGLDPRTPLRADDVDESAWPVPLDPAAASELSLARRPEVQELTASVEARRESHRAALGARLPTVGLAGAGNVGHAEIWRGTGIEGLSYAASGIVYLRWGALDPTTWRRARITDAAVGEALQRRNAGLLAVRAEAVAAAYACARAQAVRAQASETLTMADAARTAQRQRYQAGVASLLELLDAESLDQGARRRHIEAVRDHRLARVRLLSLAGGMERLVR